jgi:hypothetical protein
MCNPHGRLTNGFKNKLVFVWLHFGSERGLWMKWWWAKIFSSLGSNLGSQPIFG